MSQTPAESPGDPTTLPVDETAHLLQFLRGRDAHCPRCDYNLRDLTRTECPECGCRLTLSVGTRDMRFGLLLATATPGMFSGVAAVLLLSVLVLFTTARPPTWWPYLLIAFGLASGLSAILLYRFRVRFLRLSFGQQLIIALATWTLHIGLFCVLTLLLP